MNKNTVKNFAVWARRKLIEDIRYKASMIGITESGIASPEKNSTNAVQYFNIGTNRQSPNSSRSREPNSHSETLLSN